MKGTEDQQLLYQLLSSWRNTPNKLKKNFGTNSLRFANPLLWLVTVFRRAACFGPSERCGLARQQGLAALWHRCCQLQYYVNLCHVMFIEIVEKLENQWKLRQLLRFDALYFVDSAGRWYGSASRCLKRAGLLHAAGGVLGRRRTWASTKLDSCCLMLPHVASCCLMLPVRQLMTSYDFLVIIRIQSISPFLTFNIIQRS